MAEFEKRAKIFVSNNKNYTIPKESVGKYVVSCLRKGYQETAIINAHTGKNLTYEQILKQSINMAYNLKKNGLSKGDVVAIISPNNINYVVPVFACFYIGTIVHTMSYQYTLHELTAILNISKPKFIFCYDKNLETILKLKEEMDFIKTVITFGTKTNQVNVFDDLIQTPTNLDNFEPEEINSEDVAVIFNSSGTTGLPKCVMLTHQNIVSSVVSCRYALENFRTEEYMDFKKGDILLLPVPVFHMYGFSVFLMSLMSFTKCIIMERFIPDVYLQAIETYKINKLTCPPSLMKFLAESSLIDHYDLSSVDDITYGSAPMQGDTHEIVRKRLNNAHARQAYGITEGGICCMNPKSYSKPESCGVLVPTLMAKICNPETLELLGPNQAGEFCVKGCTIMKGYMNNPEGTEKSFDEDGFYRTGDVAYYDEDGYIFIVDRLKELIKYKGFQVSPTELENTIMTHPAVLDVGVVGIPDERAGELPMAFVVLREGFADIEEQAIVDFLSEYVNSNKWLYGGVKFVNQLPKTSSGKTMRKRLKEMANNLVELQK